jgi:hypothetical protein
VGLDAVFDLGTVEGSDIAANKAAYLSAAAQAERRLGA